MRAMVISRFGGPEVFELHEIEKPKPGPGEILVRVVAAGTNPVDAKVRQSGHWAKLTLPAIIGYDVAGVVEEAGPGAERSFTRGDEVYYTAEVFENNRGAYAEYNVVPVSIVARKPRNLSFAEASAVPLAGGTAWEAVIRRLQLRPGETILIHGAAGGVGSFAVQFARAAGARVIATASPANHEFVRALGATVALDYRADDVVQIVRDETGGRGADAAFDIEGDEIAARCLPAVRSYGRIACILPPRGEFTRLYMKNITLHGVFLTREAKRLDEMRPVFESGAVRPVIDQVLPLERVADAHRRLDTHHGRGKIILEVARG